MKSLNTTKLPGNYPGQLYVLLGGSLINSTGFGMAFPFLTLYLNTQLGIPMDRVGAIFVANAVAGLIAQLIAGPLADHVGRKPVMVAGLGTMGLVAAAFTQARTFEQFALLTPAYGFCSALYAPASNAMIVDLVGPERRAQAFGLIRVAVNVGWVLGPALGGLLATQSYSILFAGAAAAHLGYAVAQFVLNRETLPKGTVPRATPHWTGGYGAVLRNGNFMLLVMGLLLTVVIYAQLHTTAPIHLRNEAGIMEGGYGLLMALNAGIVVLFQIPTNRLVEGRNPVRVLAIAALLNMIGVATLGLGSEMPQLALSIAVLTVGEMMNAPVASSIVAALAPADMRARYMAVFNLSWTMGMGMGASAGSYVLQAHGSAWLWGSAAVVGTLSALAFPLIKLKPPANQDAVPD